MFRLHDRTRRRICLAAFGLLCVVPTVLTGGWCIWRHLPGRVAAEAAALQRELGLDVSLQGLKHLRPGIVLYEGLALFDPETGETVLRCRVLEAARSQTAGKEGQSRTTLGLIASQPEIEVGSLDRLGQLLLRLMQRRPGTDPVDLRLTAADVTLRSQQSSQTLAGLLGEITTLPNRTHAEIAFRLASVDSASVDSASVDSASVDSASVDSASVDSAEPIRIRVVRNRETIPPSTGFQLDTAGQPIPCDVLAMGLPILEPLGPRCRFRGYLWANEAPGGRASGSWNGELIGQLLDVDLGRQVTDRFPHRLSGTAQLTLRSARFYEGRLEDASGTLVAGPGVIGRSLMDAAVGYLRLYRDNEPPASGDLVPYEQLAMDFRIDSQGLTLRGRCPGGRPGAILVDRQGRWLGEPVLQPLPVVALLQTLVPASHVQVPATRQTDWLMRHLPLPAVVMPEGTGPVLPQARLRPGRTVEK